MLFLRPQLHEVQTKLPNSVRWTVGAHHFVLMHTTKFCLEVLEVILRITGFMDFVHRRGSLNN
jgi:hypothetical protein